MSSIQFINSIIGNLGASLRDGPPDDEDGDTMTVESSETSDLSRDDEELHVETLSLAPVPIREENVAGPSRTPSRALESD